MQPSPTDDLALRAQAGDPEAFEALFARVADRLLLYLEMRVGPGLQGQLEPMDALQETYCEALRSISGFEVREASSFRRWLFRIAEHRLRDLAEHHGAKKRRAPRGEQHASAVLARMKAEATGPASAWRRKELHQRLIQAISQLPERERQAIGLRYFGAFTLRDISEELGESISRVRTLLDRAKYRLGGAFEEDDR